MYAKTLDELRYKEEQIAKDKSDGIKAEARYTTVNDIYLIDEQGIIIKANDKVKAADDPENMLKELA